MRPRYHQSPEDAGSGEIGSIQKRLANNPRIDVSELEALHSESFGWALSRCGYDQEAAADVLQAAYAAIVAGKARYEGRATLKTWLFAVINRQALSRWRAVGRRLRGLERLVALRATAAAVQPDPLESHAIQHAVRAALKRLSRRQRDVIELVFYRELTLEQAAAVMGVSVGSARQHYARAKQRLNGALDHVR